MLQRLNMTGMVRDKENHPGTGLFSEQIRLIYANALPSTVAILAVTILAWIGLDEAVPAWMLNLWAGYMLFVATGRMTLYLLYTKKFDGSRIRLWAGLIIASASSAGIGWAGVSLFAHIAVDPAYKIVIVMVVLGIMAATVPVLSALLVAFFTASLPPALTLYVVIAQWQSNGTPLLLTALSVYTVLVIYTAINTNRILLRTLSLQRDKETLIDNLNIEISDRQLAQDQLELHKQNLESVVHDRTQQLSRINEELKKEIAVRQQSESELRESHDRFTAVLNTLDAAVYVADMESYEVLFMNQRAVARWGDCVGGTCWKMMQEDAKGPCEFCSNNELLSREGDPTGIYSWEHHIEETNEWLDCRDQAIQWPDGRLVRMEIATDITHRVQAEQCVRAEHQFLQTIIDGVADPIMVVDMDYSVKLMNKAAEETPVMMNDRAEQKCYQVSHGQDFPCTGDDHSCPLEIAEKTHEPVTVIHRHKTADGSDRLFEVVGTPLFDEQHRVSGIVQVSRDITAHIQTQQELQEKKTRLEHVAYHDSLTGLPNRTLLADRLNQTMAQVNRRDNQLAVAYLDLDGFKEINDTYGHEVGDLFLVALSHRVKEILREGDTIARLGGDEFVAVLVDLKDSKDSIPLLERMLSAASQPVHLGKINLQISASIGVTFYPQSEDVDADQLLRQADQAMYNAKVTGKNRYHFFEADKYRGLRGRHESVARISQGLSRNEFILHYQPRVNMRSGEIIGAEALIRWKHATRGLLLPGEFLPLIEDDELAVTLDEWVIDAVLSQMEQWKADGHMLSISVNIGARFLQKSNFVDKLNAHLQAHPQIDAGKLELEVLETSALEDMAQVSEVIKTCREMGVIFALDDFGTGYSSLTYLKLLPAEYLKIDQSFVRDMLDDTEDLAILEGVLGLATAFRREAIAEGVESIEHGQLLLQLGCDLAQGYAIARPMPADQLITWMQTWQPDPIWVGQNTVPREDVPLLFASVEHRSWVRNVENCVKGQAVSNQIMSIDDCRFGKWLHNIGHKQYGDHEGFKKVERLHRQIHNLAIGLCESKGLKNDLPIEQGLNELNSLKDALIRALNTLILRQRS
ncbi:MAG: EAL domain-containing protein [Candidatus Thiodiazotropha sp. (ex Monitilora ramsayi)]|nr:EAL domain-containing protein [Candidatus Thiodiazotropha sp. (ex Monitilora ramsayi)]